MLRSLLEKFKTKFENLADDDVDLVRYFFLLFRFLYSERQTFGVCTLTREELCGHATIEFNEPTKFRGARPTHLLLHSNCIMCRILRL